MRFIGGVIEDDGWLDLQDWSSLAIRALASNAFATPFSFYSGAPRGRSGWSGGRAGPKMGRCLPPPERRRGGRGRVGAVWERDGDGAEVAAVRASSRGRQCVGFPGCLRVRVCAWVLRAWVYAWLCVRVSVCACVPVGVCVCGCPHVCLYLCDPCPPWVLVLL